MIVNGVEYLDEDAELFPDGSVHDATLAHDVDIQGIPCAGGKSIVFYPGGRVRLAWLSRAAAVGRVACSAGLTYFHESGDVLNAELAVDQRLGSQSVPAGSRVSLDDNGGLLEYSLILEVDQIVHGLPCLAGIDVWLHESGRPSVVVLAAPTVIDDREYGRGSQLFLDVNGAILRCYPMDVDSGVRYKQRVFGVFEAAFE